MTDLDFWQRLPFAYIDPGAGSFLIQFLIAGLFGVVFTIKSYWRNLRGYLKGSISVPEDK